MTKINKMVLHGFKSFAKHTELLFGNNYNVVLGPNGSGKSNVMDALCYVLGKSSAKSLRAEKSANLIYNGGKTRSPGKQAEVSIYFDNSTKTFPTDDKEIKVSRIVRQNGQSLYRINDQKRTRQEVVDLLNIAKINPDSYNIILQGDIVRFVEMNPVERRQLIEEISGISLYEEKKDKAMNELSRVDERVKEAEIRLVERNTHLKELKKDRDQAFKFKEMSDKIKQFEASLLKIQIDKKDNEFKEINSSYAATKEDLEKIQEKITNLRQLNKQKKEEIEVITKEVEEKGEVEQVKLNKEVESLKIDLTKSNSRSDQIKNELIKISKREQELNSSIKEISDKINFLNGQKKEKTGLINTSTEDVSQLSKKVQKIHDKNKLENISEIDKEMELLDKDAEELQKKINELREEQHNLLREKDKLESIINTADERIKKVNEVEKEHKKQIDELKDRQQEFKKATLELNRLLDEDSSLAVQLSNSRKKIHESQEEFAKLNARNIGIKEFTISDKAVKKILELRQEMQGIIGIVSDLGHVNAKFSLALEIAAGPRMKSIVVEDDKTAAECIKYLKQNKLGTATFIPLNKIKPKTESQVLVNASESKGCYGLAKNLIDYDRRYEKVFSYIFADTLVVDNIDVARRIGIGTAKMVSLDGDLTEISGIMHGGFREAKKHGYGFKEKDIDKDIEKKEDDIARLEKTIDILEKRREENELRITELRQKKAILEGEILKTEKSLHLETADLEITKQKKDDLSKDMVLLDNKMEELIKEISEVNKKFASNRIKRNELRTKINELRDPSILAELTTYGEKIKQLNEIIIKLNSEIKNVDSQIIDIYNPEIEKTKVILKQLERDREDFSREELELGQKIKSFNKTLEEKESEAAKFYSKFKKLFARRSGLNDEISKNENTVNNKIDESRKVEIRNNTFSLKLAEINSQLAGLNAEFQRYEGIELDTEKNEEQLKYQISKFEKMKEEIGSVNMRALDIYEEVEKEYNSMMSKKESLEKEKNEVMLMIQEIDTKKKDLFMKTFNSVNENFKRIFLSLSTKGDSYLDLENSEDPFAEGLTVKVKISGSKFMDIRSLSGGEKTMTALAFIFAIQEYEPASFYILDEVDAALDKHNSFKFSKLISKYAEKAQYIIISHNDHVISEAQNLYGVSMNEHGMSQVVSMKI